MPLEDPKQRFPDLMRRLDNPTIHWLGEDGFVHQVLWQGQLLVWRMLQAPPSKSPGAIRGRPGNFSRSSRLRMLKVIAGLDWERSSPCLFLTLTFPDQISIRSNRDISLFRQVFWRRLEKYCGHHVPALWRVEWQVRKTGRKKNYVVPHIHILTFKEHYLPYREVNRWWKETIHVDDYVRTEVKGMSSTRQVGYYVSKYAAKVDCSLVNDAYRNSIPFGRQWGIFRKSLVPMLPESKVRLLPSPATDAARFAYLAARETYNPWGNESFTVLGKEAELIGQFLFAKVVDDKLPSR